MFLIDCSAFGGPKHSIEDLRAIYGPLGHLSNLVINSNNLEHLESLIKQSNEFDRSIMLLKALENRNEQQVELLLRYISNSDAGVRTITGGTTLLYAASRGEEKVVSMLRQAGATE